MNVSAAAMKVILLTGATDGIGYETAKLLLTQGHHLLLHGRNQAKLEKVVKELTGHDACNAEGATDGSGKVIDTLVADLSSIKDVNTMAQNVLNKYDHIDVLINNAGVFVLPPDQVTTIDGLDKRFAVNTIAPYLLTKTLLPIIPKNKGRVVNLSSAAEAPVDLNAVAGHHTRPLSDFNAYSQSKLGVTMFTYALSQQHPNKLLVSVNPASMLGTKMVKEGFGVPGNDISIGSTIIQEMATSKKYGDIKHVSGKYYDNDSKRFANPKYSNEAFNMSKCQALIDVMDTIIQEKLN